MKLISFKLRSKNVKMQVADKLHVYILIKLTLKFKNKKK